MNKNTVINNIRTSDVPTILKSISVYLRERGIVKSIKVDYYLTLARLENDCAISLTKPTKRILADKMHEFAEKVEFNKKMNRYQPVRRSVLKLLEMVNEEIRSYRSESCRYSKIPCAIIHHGDQQENIYHLYFCSPIYGMRDYNKYSFVIDTPSKMIVARKVVDKCTHLFVK